MEKVDYERLLNEHSWVCQRSLPMVVSPDFDGLLCAMLMTTYLDWQFRGFYDGRILALDSSATHIREFVFMDMEIYRPNVCSVGNHLLQWDSHTSLPNFNRTVNPNLLRGITAQEFQRKYPFGTSHLLLALFSHANVNLNLPRSRRMKAIMLYPDGTHRALLNDRSNVVDWLRWMSVKEVAQPVRTLFQSLAEMSLAEIVHGLEWLSEQLRSIGFTKKDDPCKFDPTNESDFQKARQLWLLFQQATDWQEPDLPQIKWVVHLDAYIAPLRAHLYRNILTQNPLSFALTSRARRQGLQYTLVPAAKLWLTD